MSYRQHYQVNESCVHCGEILSTNFLCENNTFFTESGKGPLCKTCYHTWGQIDEEAKSLLLEENHY